MGLLLFFTVSCIEPFQPEIREMQELLVINGKITDQPGEHFVEVSRSSSYNEPGFIPVEGCVVRVEDNEGKGFTYSEYKQGGYRVDLDERFLGINKAYKLYVYTPDGEEYQSDYDSLLPCPAIDSLYFEVERQETNNPELTYHGLQFYLNVEGDKDDSRNFLWKLEESFKYVSPYYLQYFWDGLVLHEFDPFVYKNICYKTLTIKELYTTSTIDLSANELSKYPLSYVSNKLPKLKWIYCLMVYQHSLSNDAFLYWEKMKNQSTGTGGLYERQPSSSDGNIFNANDEDEQVLGYFYASQIREKRILVENTFDFAIPNYDCSLDTIHDLAEFNSYPSYLIGLKEVPGGKRVGPPFGYAYQACFDCELSGGTTEPPDYWEKDE